MCWGRLFKPGRRSPVFGSMVPTELRRNDNAVSLLCKGCGHERGPGDIAAVLRSDLAHKIARFIGSAEKLVTAVPRMTLHRRVAPTAPCPATYEPSVTVIAQGRKEIELGSKTFVCDASKYLVTSVDLPTVSRVVEASEEMPCLALALKLDISIVRKFLTTEEFVRAPRSPGAPNLELITS
jgi:hypothetical protein